jgi:UDP-N-acetylmuramate dehydrogenase
VLIRCGAGVVWDDFVRYCVEHDYQGAENLSLIPGTCGASAVQNIGAYGVEAKDLIVSVEAVNRKTRETETIEQEHINYGYRTSNFKTLWADTYVISAVTYRLKVATHITKGLLNLTYRGLNEAYDKMSASMPHATPLAVLRHAVIAIREQKLPPVQTIGSAGSFFMNPAVSTEKARLLQEKYPDMPHYNISEKEEKIPAGWLIEQCGWKGKTLGMAGVHDKQALVLVNKGGAKGEDIVRLCNRIRSDVSERFGITITPEVNIV